MNNAMSITVITKEELNAIYEEGERVGKELVEWLEFREGDDGRQYDLFLDKRKKTKFAVWRPRTVFFGLNTIPEDKLQEFVELVEREGGARACWTCDGRTLHQILANQLATKLPQYRFDIGYNYHCFAYKD